MRSLAALTLLLGLALAGCAEEAAAPGRTASPISTTVAEEPVPPLLAWRSLGATAAIVSPSMTSFDVAVPADVLTVVVNQTYEAGAAYGLSLALGGCSWVRPQTFVGAGQTVGADCGGVPEGTWPLQVSTSAGALSTTIEPFALVCEERSPRWRCPAPVPPSTG